MKTTVVRAYVIEAGEAQRVIAKSTGEVYTPRGGWQTPTGEVVTVKGTYERWSDVPHAWLGQTPWWM